MIVEAETEVALEAALKNVQTSIIPAISALTAENARLRSALKSILFRRPGGPCSNKIITDMEDIARAALEGKQPL